jgi:putative ABC transport system permease protein
MRRLSGRTPGWWRVLTGSASTSAVALGILLCLFTLLAVAGPRADAQLRTIAFRHVVATAPATDKAVVGSVSDTTLGVGEPQGLDAGQVERTKDALRRNLQTLPLSPARADWSSLTTPFLFVTGYGPAAVAVKPPKLELSYRDALAQNVRVIAGALPGGKPVSGGMVILQTAVTAATARRFGVRVGSRLPLPGTSLVLAVTAIVQPKDAAAPFWTIDPVVATPQLQNPLSFNSAYWAGGFFIAAGAVRALQSHVNISEVQVTWMLPMAIGNFTAARGTQLQSTLAGALSTAGHVTVSATRHGGVPLPIVITLSSRTGALIARFQAEAASVASVLDLLSVSLAVLAAVVVLLSGWLLAERRRPDFAVLRARGATRRQLALAVLGGTAVTAVPGAVVGAIVAVAVIPASPVPLSWWLAGLVVLAALAGPVLVTVQTHRGYAAVARPDAPPARVPAVRRLVVESGLVLVAAGGLTALRHEGTGASGDVYASAVPILLAVGVAVVVLRVYPPLVRGTLRLRGERASAATFVGLSRAARASATAALPAFAMVLALAVLAFAGMVRDAVVNGEVDSSWQQAGADAVISEPVAVGDALQRAVAAVPGVQHVAVAGIVTAATTTGHQVDVLAVDPGQYAALVAGTPLPQPPRAFTASARAGPAPALAAPGVDLGSGPVGVLISGHTVTAHVVGGAANMSALPSLSDGNVVLPRRALGSGAPSASTLLVRGSDLNRAALAAAVARDGPGGTIVYRSQVLAGLEQAPLQHGAYLVLGLGAGAAGCCCLLVLLLSLLLSASARRLALARLATMGLSAGQGRVLGLVELLPQLVAVLTGGLVCAAALVPLTGPALSLGIFTGSSSSVPVRIEPVWLAGAGAGLLVLELVMLTGQSLLTDRYAPVMLRIGE